MLEDQLLEEFIFGFHGYGNYAADYWFVGTEEGIRKSKDPTKLEGKLHKKLKKWHDRGSQELEDLRDFHLALGPNNKRFAKHAALDVATWRAIIHVLLCIEGKEPKRPDVREYQRIKLARQRDSDSCLLELLPLPSPDENSWPKVYGKHSPTFPFLKSRQAYVEHVAPGRVKHLKSKIEEHTPKVVLFYGKAYRAYQKEIADVEFTKRNGVKVGKSKDTLFVLSKHPNAKGVTNAYFNRIGKMIRGELKRP